MTTLAVLFAFLHYMAAFALVAALVMQKLLLRDLVDVAQCRRLLHADIVYGVSAGVVLLAGLARVLWTEKGTFFYLHNIAFHGKVTAFVVVGLLSIWPTVQYASWRRYVRAGQMPALDPARVGRMRLLVNLQLAGIVAIVLCANLMARGLGFRG